MGIIFLIDHKYLIHASYAKDRIENEALDVSVERGKRARWKCLFFVELSLPFILQTPVIYNNAEMFIFAGNCSKSIGASSFIPRCTQRTHARSHAKRERTRSAAARSTHREKGSGFNTHIMRKSRLAIL